MRPFPRRCVPPPPPHHRRMTTLGRLRLLSSLSPHPSTEVQKFSAMDAHWWDATLNPLVHMNTVRVQYIRDVVHTFRGRDRLHELSALDIGCGGGLLSESLARLGASNVIGLDPSQRLIDAARHHASLDPQTRHAIQYWTWTAHEFRQQQQQAPSSSSSSQLFDLICLLDVIEHVPNVPSLLEDASLLLQENGLLFVSTLNRTVVSHFVTILGAEYVMGYLPVGTHDWNHYWMPSEVQHMMDNVGLEQVNVCGMVVSKPPSLGIFCGGRDWQWRLDPNNTTINWIGAYTKKPTR